jgi:adenosylmethionine---8-amino-7-oxononanoate aminotransferase
MEDLNNSQLVDLDHAHVWHPFCQFSEWSESEPLMIERAEGCELIDTLSRRYIDAVGSLWVGVHGHRHPVVDAAVKAQLDRIAHSTFLGLSHPPAVTLAKKLVDITPERLNRVFFSDSGSTAVEVALKMAFQSQQQRGETQRTRFASLSQAYHGDTVGAVSVGGIDLFHGVYKPLLFEALHLPCPDHFEDEEILANQAISLLENEGDRLVALIVEPLVQGAAGMRMHSPKYLNPILAKARELGALVILDEVATGFGRTGTLFACEQLEIEPDFLCLGKGLTNGYLPLAVTLASEAVFETFIGAHAKTFFHGHTYTANPLGCAAANACLELFESESTMEGVSELVDTLKQSLERLKQRKDIARVRQKGLMVGIDLLSPEGKALNAADRTGNLVCQEARHHGVILRPLGDTLVMMPPLCMSTRQVKQVVSTIEVVLDGLAGVPAP